MATVVPYTSRRLLHQTVMRVWDALFHEGPKILFRVALSLLKIYEENMLRVKDAGGYPNHICTAGGYRHPVCPVGGYRHPVCISVSVCWFLYKENLQRLKMRVGGWPLLPHLLAYHHGACEKGCTPARVCSTWQCGSW